MTGVPRARRPRRVRAPGRERGLALLAVLIALMLVTIALSGALDVWALQRRRQQEEELLFVGNQYRHAIEQYYRAGRTWPVSIEDLLNDNRFPVPVHHLRRAYADPITGKNDWIILKQGDAIYGVASSSGDAPLKHANFPRRYVAFADAKSYGEWQFYYLPLGRHSPGATNLPVTPAPVSPSGPSRQPGSAKGVSPFSPNGRF
ncbi:hypothetical protein PTE30175_00867 [Pandoraea terrae]|uniref:Type II secretory pathway, pseudopilin PulG n=1 Tax=Pandoraea terrae TaxID=1537710 RepID=A0A5E4SQ47_9BURK|nr:type II secretion system protein [Pandoraea terrae]VVD77092.1 hypothetical protein PTE30175_00867 [Pandoraea terrae]